jgi:hypothetical protein
MKSTQRTRNFQSKLFKNDRNRSIYVQFECIIKELCGKKKYTFQENLKLVLKKLWQVCKNM